jgi:histidinol-phosphate aminotransferase
MMKSEVKSTRLSRRAMLGGLAAVAASPVLAQASAVVMPATGLHADLLSTFVPGGVYINANENPLGPCAKACKAVIEMMPMAGRYDKGVETKVAALFAEQNGLKPNNVAIYAGSYPGLHSAGLAFSSAERGIVTGNPTFDSMFYGPNDRKPIAPIKQVVLTPDYRLDVKAMAAADPNPGIIYLCNPNNPTGTHVSRDEIAWLLKNKPKGSIVIVDEAYIHYSDAETAIPFVAAGEDIIVSRTFSKIYGMAGLRCGAILARPDLLTKVQNMGSNPMPTPALAAALISLQDPMLLTTRRKYNNDTREEMFVWLKAKGYEYVPSQTNFFMAKVNRPGGEVTKALADRKVFIGGPRPHMADWVRVSVGTPVEMKKFREAFQAVMAVPPAAKVG